MTSVLVKQTFDMISPASWGSVTVNENPSIGQTIVTGNAGWMAKVNYVATLNGNAADSIEILNNGNGIATFSIGYNKITGANFINPQTIIEKIKGGAFVDAISALLQGKDTIIGSVIGSDKINAGPGDDQITQRGGGEYIDGGPGIDTVTLRGNKSEYTITKNGAMTTVTDNVAGRDGIDTLQNVENLKFKDGNLAISANSIAAKVYSFYDAVLDRAPDPQGLSYWEDKIDEGATIKEFAASVVASPEFKGIYQEGTETNATFVESLYKHVLNRSSDAAGKSFWTAFLDNGGSRTDAALAFSDSAEYQKMIVGTLEKGIAYQDWVS